MVKKQIQQNYLKILKKNFLIMMNSFEAQLVI